MVSALRLLAAALLLPAALGSASDAGPRRAKKRDAGKEIKAEVSYLAGLAGKAGKNAAQIGKEAGVALARPFRKKGKKR